MKNLNISALIVLMSIIFVRTPMSGQELLANVIVDGEMIQTQEKQIFQDMKQNITQFLNTRKWTNDKYAPNERIKVNIMIKLQDMPSTGRFKATTQIQTSRPIHGTGYESVMLNFLDKDFTFDYTQSQPIEYNDASYTTNLGSLLGFYVNIILGLDYDSYQKNAGMPYFEKAQLAVNNAQQTSEPGWKQFDNDPNSRYWLIENLMNPQFKDFRDANYLYHRQGLDFMSLKPDETRAKVIESLILLKKVHDVKPNSCLLRTYFNTKDNEIVNILMEGTSQDKSKAVELLKIMDPTNADKYDKLIKG